MQRIFQLLSVMICLGGISCKRIEAWLAPPPGGPPQLLVVSSLQGTTEPCGCTSDPLGGLDRLAGVVERAAAGAPAELVAVGDTFFSAEEQAAVAEESSLRRARTVARVLGQMRPVAVVPGVTDWQRARREVSQWAEQDKWPLFDAPQ